MTTPPGWYPDPGHTGHGPARERWWDGATWTDYTREPQGVVASQVPPVRTGFGPPEPPLSRMTPVAPSSSGYAVQPPAVRGRGKAVALAGGAVVLAAALIGGIALTSGGGDSSAEAGAKVDASPSRSVPGTAGGSGGGTVIPSPGPTGAIADVANGISVPVLGGWRKGRSGSGGAAVTTGPYPCPTEPATSCVRGGVFTSTVLGSEAESAESIAKEDIVHNAEDSYGKDPQGGKQMYGGITAHRQVKSGPLTVAGQKGYLVRWRVSTGQGDGGFVQSLAFPSPAHPDSFVLVRFGFDASQEAPPLSDMDVIADGIRALPAGGTGGSGGA